MHTKSGTAAMTQIALLTALVAVLSQLAVPMPSNVPLTLQTFAVALCGYLGGAKKGASAVVLYLLLGAAGIPVFSSFRSGIGILLGYTGGFLWGFLPLALLCGIRPPTKRHSVMVTNISAIGCGLCGLLLCHICGIVQYAFTAGLPWQESALLISVPYIGKDLLLLAAAYAASAMIRRALKTAGLEI